MQPGAEIEVVDGAVLGVDVEPPGQIRGLAEQLLVPPVAPAADRLGEQEPGREAVGEQRDALARSPDDDAAGDDAEEDAAPDAEAALPDREGPPPLVRQLVVARDDVVEPRADDARRDAPDGGAQHEVPVAAAPRPAHAGEADRSDDGDEQRDPVHVDRQRPDVDRAGGRRRERGEEARHASRILPCRARAAIEEVKMRP